MNGNIVYIVFSSKKRWANILSEFVSQRAVDWWYGLSSIQIVF